MIKTAGHTMATPGYTLAEALGLFAALGFDGAEIICADDYGCGLPTRPTTARVQEVRVLAQDLGLEIANLVPYVRSINSRNSQERQRSVDDMLWNIELAAALGSPSVRVWAGVEPDPGHETEQFDLLIGSLQELLGHAAEHDVVLSIENHMGSHAVTGEVTARIVEAVGSPHVGILYDAANLLVLGDTDYRAAFRRQAPHIRHVHFKDVDVLGGGKHMPRVAGEGEVPWEWILPELMASGYEGFITTEFEKRWHPEELPSSQDGLAHELAELQRLLAGPRQG